jgi:hypothetical protein
MNIYLFLILILILILIVLYNIMFSNFNNNNSNSNSNSNKNDCENIKMNSYELVYNKDIWDNNKYSNNCYAYATNNLYNNRKTKPQPGEISNLPKITKEDYTCNSIETRMKKDYPNIYNVKEDELCKEKYYKIALAVDPKKDYHFYRQDFDGYWSHKPGHLIVRRIDASKNKIKNPRCADRKYKHFDYSDFCGYYCFSK